MNKRTYRLCQGLLLLLTFFVLLIAFYFQYVGGLHPCPLCVMQRICAFLLAIVCLVGLSLVALKRSKFILVFQMLFAALGLYFAGRQMWLQSLDTDHIPTCMPDLDVLIRYFPWHDVVHALLWGAGDCAEVSWQWLGLSMPGWAALYFLFMLVVSGGLFFMLCQTSPTFNKKIDS